ncbi:unnamed protein product, partial [Cyprideis torosa]
MARPQNTHLPTTMEECLLRGWQEVDIVFVTGDSYVDHPSFGVALLGRLLESEGYRVAILPQPHHHGPEDFRRFGKPKICFAITAGSLDSIVANYTGNGKVREQDSYSPDGNPWRCGKHEKANRRRPDRATIAYANLARAAYGDAYIILGGVEASLRRFIHFDYKQNKLRNSVLTDAKADLLLYGMAERALLSVACDLAEKRLPVALRGSCIRLSDREFEDFVAHSHADKIVLLPGWYDIENDKKKFMQAEQILDQQGRSGAESILAQRQSHGYVVQFPAQQALNTQELDALYALPYNRTPHPLAGNIPAYTMIRHSITIVRGCAGNCAFCAITRHQGAETTNRSKASILKEIAEVAAMDDFTGTISDLGGPTANLYGSSCTKGGCKKRDCLFPRVCRFLETGEKEMLTLLDAAEKQPGVKKVFISSGLRLELLLKTPRLLQRLLDR